MQIRSLTLGLMILVWGVAVAGTLIMRKIEPDNKVYPIYVTMVAISFTLIALWCEYQA